MAGFGREMGGRKAYRWGLFKALGNRRSAPRRHPAPAGAGKWLRHVGEGETPHRVRVG